ncbi:MAG: SRPBCC domain-containing protein [Deltaproteobacteria bacterium]|nr:SRPBCC domain-containing protein [Deltaproteobacteria bacterium]
MTNDTNLTISVHVPQSPSEVFDAIRDVRSWWSAGLEGASRDVGDVFRYRHGSLHDSRQEVIESRPGRSIAWRVLDAHLSFADKPGEWKGTTIRFDLSEVEGGTLVRFTHEGIGPSCDCYDACSKGWALYVGESLRARILTGRGIPDTEHHTRPA